MSTLEWWALWGQVSATMMVTGAVGVLAGYVIAWGMAGGDE